MAQFRSKISSSKLLLLTAGGGGACCWLGFGGVGMPSCQVLPVGPGPSAQSCYLALLVRTRRACRVWLHPWGRSDTWTWAHCRHASWHACVHIHFEKPVFLKCWQCLWERCHCCKWKWKRRHQWFFLSETAFQYKIKPAHILWFFRVLVKGWKVSVWQKYFSAYLLFLLSENDFCDYLTKPWVNKMPEKIFK